MESYKDHYKDKILSLRKHRFWNTPYCCGLRTLLSRCRVLCVSHIEKAA